MYPKKTLSAASLLSECERKRCRSLEARGCAKSESEFSMGTAATCPFPMSEQSPRSIKLHQSVYARSNDQPLRQTENYIISWRVRQDSTAHFTRAGIREIFFSARASSSSSRSSSSVISPLIIFRNKSAK